MPLHWRIDSLQGLVTVVGEGDITRADVDAYIDSVVGSGALPYRKLLDATAARAAMSAEEMLMLGVRFKSYLDQPMGPLAIVMPRGWTNIVARVMGILATGKRPMRIFSNLKAAQSWIDRLAATESKAVPAPPARGASNSAQPQQGHRRRRQQHGQDAHAGEGLLQPQHGDQDGEHRAGVTQGSGRRDRCVTPDP